VTGQRRRAADDGEVVLETPEPAKPSPPADLLPDIRIPALARATADLEPPFAVVDLGAFDANAAALHDRTGRQATIRLATKSVRCRALIDRASARQGFHGLLAFTLPEALWLAGQHEDVVIGYPTADRDALRKLGQDEQLRSRVTLMVDSPAHLEFVASATGAAPSAPIKVAIDVDASLELAGGRIHLGPYRSPAHSPAQALALARAIADNPSFTLDGIMSYEGQIAGLGDNQPGSPARRALLRVLQRMSARELAARRAEVVAAVSQVVPLRFVNGGGTGSVEQTAAELVITEIGAGSGLYAPGLFDFYRRFRPYPAAFFVLPVVRRPNPHIATVLGGGWVASGPPGRDRLPLPAWPRGLRLSALEAAGEVQTPLLGEPANRLRIGDRVWFRHSKAGELCERVNHLYLVSGDTLVGHVPTYRGEGHAFL
jgi:D-serine deaminase-like pyridoxal phosphate-dependent protein